MVASHSGGHYVYIYEDEFGVPCYVGVGSGDRIEQHMWAARGNGKGCGVHLLPYLRCCLGRGIELRRYKVAEELTRNHAYSYEMTLIAWYGRRDLETGCLLNGSGGGSGSRDLLPSTRAKISEMAKNRPPEVHAKMQAAAWAARRGSKHSEETKIKMRKPHTLSPEGLAIQRLNGGKIGWVSVIAMKAGRRSGSLIWEKRDHWKAGKK